MNLFLIAGIFRRRTKSILTVNMGVEQMRRLFSVVLSVLMVLLSVPVAVAEPPQQVTIGFLPVATEEANIIIRGTAPQGMTVTITVNDRVAARTPTLPDMSVYHTPVDLDAGYNRITVAVEGTDLQAQAALFRITQTFNDMENHWAKIDSEILATLGIVNGVGNGEFGPDLSLTRAQYAKLVVLGMGLSPEQDPVLTFVDAADIPDWARGYVAVAVQQGLITGFEDGTFRAGEPVSRAQVAVVAARALRDIGIRQGRGQLRHFRDDDRIPAWAQADVNLTTSAGVISDFWGDSFIPDAPATRGLAAAVVRRLYSAGK
jgi:hypothetical protein